MSTSLAAVFASDSRTQRLSFLRFVRACTGEASAYCPDPDDRGFLPGPSAAPYGRGPLFGVTRGQDFAVDMVRDLLSPQAVLYCKIAPDDQAHLCLLGPDNKPVARTGEDRFKLPEQGSQTRLRWRAPGPTSWEDCVRDAVSTEGSEARARAVREAFQAEQQALLALGRSALEHAATQEARRLAQRDLLAQCLAARPGERGQAPDQAALWASVETQRGPYRQAVRAQTERLLQAWHRTPSWYAPSHAEPWSAEEEQYLQLFLARKVEGASTLLSSLPGHETEYFGYSSESLQSLRDYCRAFLWNSLPARAHARVLRTLRQRYWDAMSRDGDDLQPRYVSVALCLGDETQEGPVVGEFSVAIYACRQVSVQVHYANLRSPGGLQESAKLVDSELAQHSTELPWDDGFEATTSQLTAYIESQLHTSPTASVPNPFRAGPPAELPPLLDAQLRPPWEAPGELAELPRLEALFHSVNSCYAPVGLRFVPSPRILVQHLNPDPFDLETPPIHRIAGHLVFDNLTPNPPMGWYAKQLPLMDLLHRGVPEALNLFLVPMIDRAGIPKARDRYYFYGYSTNHRLVQRFGPTQQEWPFFSARSGPWTPSVHLELPPDDTPSEPTNGPTVFPERAQASVYSSTERVGDAILAEHSVAKSPGYQVGCILTESPLGNKALSLGVMAHTLAHEFAHVLGCNHYAHGPLEDMHNSLWAHRCLMYPQVELDAKTFQGRAHPRSRVRLEYGYGSPDGEGLCTTGNMLMQKVFQNPENKLGLRSTQQADGGNEDGQAESQAHARVLREGVQARRHCIQPSNTQRAGTGPC